MVGGAAPPQRLVQGCIRKQAEHVSKNIAPGPLCQFPSPDFCPDTLPLLPVMMG